MNDALVVCGLQAGGDLPRDDECVFERKGTPFQTRGQVRAVDVLERQGDGIVRFFEAVDRRDVG
jgi:hypothetical protein